jgi:hypothetical protein
MGRNTHLTAGQRRRWVIGLNTALLAAEIVGFILAVQRRSFSSFFVFFTNDSNLLAAVSAICLLFFILKNKDAAPPRWITQLRYIATLCLSLTFFVVILVLAPMMGSYYELVISGEFKCYHLICPILSFISFVFFEKGNPPLQRKDRLIALIPVVLYAFILVCLNAAGVVNGPYPFLRVRSQPLWQSALWCVFLVGGYDLFGALLQKLIAKYQ